MIEAEHYDGWAVRRRNGSVIVEVGPEASEKGIWNIALGWPSAEEIAWEKVNGGRAFRCRVTPMPEDDGAT
jgi:hypothetical protein